ncbi:MAG: hypothetical protein JWL95_322 [Gemmatimonadetes bacterium]|nr:hypothetical protein [Gemmatimonadota bacterium]
MPTTVTLDRATGIRITTATGVVSGQDFVDIYHQIIADPELSHATRSLVDLREASFAEFTSGDVRAAVNLPQLPRQAETRMAIVATTAVAYGMSRMYAMMQEGERPGEAQVFQSYDEALDWLGADTIKSGTAEGRG